MYTNTTIRSILLLCCILCLGSQLAAQVAINQDNSSPDPSAMLDVKSSDKGVLIPRMGTTQREAIADPATGLLVFDTDTESFWFRDSTTWVEIRGGNAVPQGLLLSEDCYIYTTLDASNDGGFQFSNFLTSPWQSFTAETNGYITSFEVRVGPGGSSSIGIFQLYQGEGTSGALLYEKTINEDWFAGWHTVLIPFADSVYLTAGAVYTWSFTSYIDIIMEISDLDGYSGGRASTSASEDFFFRTYLSNCNLHYLADAPTPNGTTNLNHIDTIFFSDGTILTSLYDDQTISLSGTTLSIADGNSVDLAGIDTDTDDQTLSLSGTTLSIEDGNSVDLSGINSAQTLIQDADADTKIQVEKSPDEDTIRFDIGGTEYFKMSAGRLEVLNTGYSVFLGQEAGRNDDLTDNRNTLIGYGAGQSNITGEVNVAVGSNALSSNTSGSGNTAVGVASNALNTTGNNNVAVGAIALANNVSGSYNTMVGTSAGHDVTTGSENVGIGWNALSAAQTGTGNVAIGHRALGEIFGNSSNNTAIGYQAGDDNNGSNNVFLGYQAGFNKNGSNKLYIENSNSASPLIYGEFDNDLLRINGTLNINNAFSFPTTDGTAGQVLATDGAGLLSWMDKTVDTDDQTLSLSGTTLSIQDGNNVDLASLPFANSWSQTGNAGTTAGTNFIGTTDDVALDFRVNNQRGLRLIPKDDNSVNVLGGYSGNSVSAGIYSATIAGGGSPGNANSVTASWGTVAGGMKNIAGSSSTTVSGGVNNQALGSNSTISGGSNNTISTITGVDAVIGGGFNNTASKLGTTIAGGRLNVAGGQYAVVGGGAQNNATGHGSVIPGGTDNDATGRYSYAAGQLAKANHDGAFVWADNTPAVFSSTAANQFLIRATNGVGINKNNPATALDVNGTVTATAFSGDGSALTGIPDDQTLNLSGTTLSIEDGNSVNLSSINTDDQALSLSGNTLSIEDGNSVNLSSINTDDQTLNLSGNTLSIESGNSVNLSGINTDNQTLSLSGTTLSIAGGNSVDLTSLLPVGTIQMWPTATPPAGWLICDGSTFSAATYPALNTVLGGNTLPDFKGRFPLGSKPAPVPVGQTNFELKTTGGEEKHTLTVAEMPAHNHSLSYQARSKGGSGPDVADLTGTGATATTASTGGGQPHNNMPPYFVINFIIKAQ